MERKEKEGVTAALLLRMLNMCALGESELELKLRRFRCACD